MTIAWCAIGILLIGFVILGILAVATVIAAGHIDKERGVSSARRSYVSSSPWLLHSVDGNVSR